MNRENPVIAFARDFSGNDAAIMAKVAAYVAEPPSDDATIGFHGVEGHSPRERLFLATVALLDDRGKLDSVEDKETLELLWRWRDSGVIDRADLPSAAAAVFGPILDMPGYPQGAGPDWFTQEARSYPRLVWNDYAEATRELEAHIAMRGKVLLSIDTLGGDTMFFALVEPGIATKWRNKALFESVNGYRGGVRAPMWDVFWGHLLYSIDGAFRHGEEFEGYPPGTQPSDNAIPFAD
jgi:hypothetical protein